MTFGKEEQHPYDRIFAAQAIFPVYPIKDLPRQAHPERVVGIQMGAGTNIGLETTTFIRALNTNALDDASVKHRTLH